MKTLVICSGGLDSVTLAYQVAAQGELAALLSFDYGQRHKKELAFADACAKKLGASHAIIDIRGIGARLGESALTSPIEIPDGHYAEETMAVTIVPNRNAIMLTIAYGVAVAQKVDAVGAAFHSGDHFIYPDCRPAFVETFARMQDAALDDVAKIALFTPFLFMSKFNIVKQGAKLGVPFDETWSCYKGRAIHCGRCGTCVERREAFHLAGVEDPTIYDDPEFWKTAVACTSAF